MTCYVDNRKLIYGLGFNDVDYAINHMEQQISKG